MSHTTGSVMTDPLIHPPVTCSPVVEPAMAATNRKRDQLE